MPSGRVYYSPGDSRHARRRNWRARSRTVFLPRRAVDPFGGITRVGYDDHALLPVTVTDPVGNTVTAEQRLPRPAARHGHRPERQPGVGRLRRPRPRHRHRRDGQDDRGPRRPADRLHRRPGRCDAARAVRRPARRPGRRPGQRHHPVPLRPRRLPADQHAGAAAAARHVHAGPGDPRLRPGPERRRPGISTTSATSTASAGRSSARPRWRPARSQTAARRSRRAGPGPAGRSSTTRDGRSVSTSRSSRRPAASSSPRRPGSARSCSTTRRAAWWPRSTRTARGRTWSSIPGWNSTGTSTTPCWCRTRALDPDVGNYFQRLLGSGPFTSWYQLRSTGTYGATAQDQAAQQDAAEKAAAHADTPAVSHRDSAGRACLAVADNGGGARYPARTAYDTEGRPLAVIDALGRRTEEYVYRNPAAAATWPEATWPVNPLYRVNADAGARRDSGERRRAADPQLGRPRTRVPPGVRRGPAADAPLREDGRRAPRS